ncbi:hypothetical protein INR49_025427 [Caranx melampygus]|nr:hypothetical protein INR49_025427 [Caranx melampygus]
MDRTVFLHRCRSTCYPCCCCWLPSWKGVAGEDPGQDVQSWFTRLPVAVMCLNAGAAEKKNEALAFLLQRTELNTDPNINVHGQVHFEIISVVESRDQAAEQLSLITSSLSRMSTAPQSVAAVCQVTATPDKEANFSACKNLVEEAKERGAGMVFLPEGFDYIGSSREETLSLSESLTGDTISRYTQLARKSHLFDVELPEKGVSLKESAFTIPGPSMVSPVQTPIGKVGLGICYDLRFPELSVALQRNGAEILTYPSAFTVATGVAHWEVLLRARAIETQCYVVAAAQVGRHHEKRSSYGHALVVDPWGEVVGDCGGDNPGMVLVEINLGKVSSTRRNMPVQQHRRDTDFYYSLEKT